MGPRNCSPCSTPPRARLGQRRHHAPNVVLHPWLTAELEQVLAELAAVTMPETERPPLARWETWEGPPRPMLPPLRLILVWDNLAGHLTPELVIWLYHHGVLPLYTPLSGSWLNMAESVQRILVRRALAGQHPQTSRRSSLAGGDRDGMERAPTPLPGMASAMRGASAPGDGAISAWHVPALPASSLFNSQMTH